MPVKGKRSAKRIHAFVQTWCKEVTKEAAYEAHEEGEFPSPPSHPPASRLAPACQKSHALL